MFQRSHLQELTKRMNEPRKFIQILMGPRQTGKTTIVNQFLANTNTGYHFALADAVNDTPAVWLDQQWEAARLKMSQANAREYLLVIDEIQKIRNWAEIVKQCWDTDTREVRNLKVILLGSSRLLLQQGLTESLAGRFESISVGHWSFAEMRQAFGWTAEEYAWFGGYPGAASLISDEIRWKAYVRQALIDATITRDILMLTRIDKPALMSRLFEIGCMYSGQILSFTKLLGRLQDAGNTTTLSHYLSILESAGLLAGIEKFAFNIIRKRSSSPKFQVFNTALISAQRDELFPQIRSQRDTWGRIVESAVGAHLLNHATETSYQLSYWRERNAEVDFVLRKNEKIIAIEVKSGHAKPSSGIEAFRKQYRGAKVLLIGDQGVPWQEFLELSPELTFSHLF